MFNTMFFLECGGRVDPYGWLWYPFGDEPFVVLLESSTFDAPGGGKESVYWLYLVTTVMYFAII